MLEKVEVVIGQYSNENLTIPYLNYVLPAATFAEKNGTFINFDNRIQIINQAFLPLGDSKPDWLILIELAKEIGIELQYVNENDIWKKMKAAYPFFANIDYKKIGSQGIKLNLIA